VARFQEVVPKSLGRVVHFVIEEFQPVQLSFAFLVAFNMHRVEGDGGFFDQSMQARDEIKLSSAGSGTKSGAKI
jgi:hypothetical protein